MRVLYTTFRPEKISADCQQHWLEQCPVDKQERINRLRRRQDQLRSLIGLQLLKTGMISIGHDDFLLSSVTFYEERKPDCPYPVDFSISHSAELVVCAIGQKGPVGVDAEKIRDINVEVFKRYFSNDELARFQQDPSVFFDLWSVKEAVMKATGKANLADLRHIHINNNSAVLRNNIWYLHPQVLHPEFKVTIATSTRNPSIIKQEIDVEQ